MHVVVAKDDLKNENVEHLKGLVNLQRHVENVKNLVFQ
ncbi:MAG: hypothetical protein CM15mP106_5880 [Candidatus Neomarinimicrobiota bacterium]|nr:MAG: hypothetical protein CM15mP106_5880 [Candidatus Neomarinimicrobiota bacterium]